MSKLKAGGGIGRVVFGAAHALAQRGYEVHVAGPAPDPVPEALGSVRLHPWPKPRLSVQQVPDLIKLQRRLRADVVHFHSAQPHGEMISVLLGLRPVLGSPRLCLSPYTSARSHYPKRRGRVGLRAVDAVVCNSQWSADRAIRAGARAKATHVVHAGIDLPGTVPESKREPIVVALARLVKVKGIDVLIEAFDLAAAARADWHLVIGGAGALANELKAQARASKAAHRIEFPGWIESEGKEDLLARASIGVVPSLQENFPGSLMDLQSRGLACIASSVGGIPELSCEGEAALLVRPADPEALARALGELMDDPARRLALGAAGRRLSSRFTWSAMAEGLERVYEGLLSRV